MQSKVLNSLFIETGRFCKVEFIKNNGEVSVVHGRTGVHKYSKGGRRTTSDMDYILFYDLKRGYRNIKRDRVVSINGEKLSIKVK